MKKYNSYFNKRYFPDDAEGGEEQDEAPQLSGAQPGGAEITDAVNTALDTFVPDVPEPSGEKVQEPAPVPAYTPAPQPAQAEAAPRADEGEATIISKSAVISGELNVEGDIHLFGKIKGNVTAKGNLEIAGKVIGNVTGNDIELSHCELKGDVSSSGFVFMDKDSLMIGNITSQDITLDGKVKGDISASRKVYVRSNAIIMGNIRAGSIAIDEGASLQGQVIIANQEEEGMNINEESQAGV